jgi:spore germination cell wall hydrolase CwlJ-like protein
MYSKKSTNKFLIIFSILLIAINLLVPAARAYAQNQSTIEQQVGEMFKEEAQCLAENVYYEAAKESYEGKLAVAQVTLNRVNSGKFPSTICGVVKQKDRVNGVMVCQFSWFCNAAYIKLIRNPYQWEESVLVANKALTNAVAHDTLYHSKALYFHANYINPNWNLTKVAQIGNHIFYKEKNKI